MTKLINQKHKPGLNRQLLLANGPLFLLNTVYFKLLFLVRFCVVYQLCGCYFAFAFLNQFSPIPFTKISCDKFGKQLRNQVIDLNL